MILSFNCRGVRYLLLVLLTLAATLPGCARPDGTRQAETRGRVSEVIGALKLLRQEYVNAVAPAGATVIDATEYAETELFAEQAEVKFAALAKAGEAGDAERARRIGEALTKIRAGIAAKAPHADVIASATNALVLVEELLAGALPDEIRGAVLATTRADQAIAAEEIVGDYRVGVASGPARAIFRREAGSLVPAPAAPAGAVYVAALIRERRTKRFLPAAAVTLAIESASGRSETPLSELWGDFHQYGANVVLPSDGPVTLSVRAAPPAYDRHSDMLSRFVTPVSATLKGQVRDGTLTFDARPVQPTDADYAVGDDVLQALTEAGTMRDAGAYRVGVIVEGPEPIWQWKDGAPVLQPVAAGATNHVEVVLLDRETGQLVPNGHVMLTFLAGGRAVGNAMLHPLLSIFSHYGETLTLPAGATTVRVHIDPPALGALDRQRLAEPVEIELPLPARRGGAA